MASFVAQNLNTKDKFRKIYIACQIELYSDLKFNALNLLYNCECVCIRPCVFNVMLFIAKKESKKG